MFTCEFRIYHRLLEHEKLVYNLCKSPKNNLRRHQIPHGTKNATGPLLSSLLCTPLFYHACQHRYCNLAQGNYQGNLFIMQSASYSPVVFSTATNSIKCSLISPVSQFYILQIIDNYCFIRAILINKVNKYLLCSPG